MSGKNWARIWELFTEARDLEPGARGRLLADLPPEIAAEVRALIDEESAQPSGPAPGARYGRYTLIDSLGRGGMGQVFSARDSELGRMVAMKFLNVRNGVLPEAVRQLVAEAQTASALNHPNLIVVHEILRHDSDVAVVSELVKGQALRGFCGVAQPVHQVAAWGAQMALGLAAAHAESIVHGDIKPENVMIRGDGYIKILDFGIARQNARCDIASLPSGTVGYMSPEQIRGEALAAASDVFSLGVVLLELATGRHPFLAETPASTALAIGECEAEVQVPPIARGKEFARLLQSMLEKTPGRRPTATVVASRLERIATERRIGPVWWIAAAAVALTAAYLFREFYPVAPHLTVFQGTLLTGSPGNEGEPAFSPDSESLVYSWDGGSGGKRDIWVKSLRAGDSRRLTSDPADESDPCWLAGGSAVVFLRRAPSAYQVVGLSISGGAEQNVTTISNSQEWIQHRLACSPAGAQLVVSDDPPDRPGNQHLYVVSLPNWERRVLTAVPAQSYDFWPRISPDGHWVAYVRGGNGYELRVTSIDGGESRLLAKMQYLAGLAWSSDSKYVLYQIGSSDPNNIWQVPAQGGVPVVLPFTLEPNARDLALSADGRKIAHSLGGGRVVNLWRVFPNGQPAVELAPSTRPDTDGAWSPDGKSIAFASDRSGSAQLWVASDRGTNVRAITDMKAGVGSPAWSHDGQRVAFDASNGSDWIGLVSAEGGAVKPLLADQGHNYLPSWSGDDKSIYFCSLRTGARQIWRAPSAGGTATQITHAGGFESHESPDGQFLYYSKWRANGIWRLPVSGHSAVEEKVAEFDPAVQFRCWDVGALGLYIASPGPKPSIELLPFSGVRRRIVTLPAELPKSGRCVAVNPNGQSFLFPVADADRSEIYVGDNPGVR